MTRTAEGGTGCASFHHSQQITAHSLFETMMNVVAACAAVSLASRPCDVAPLQGSTLCDESRSTQERAYWIVNQLTLDEKISITQNGASPVSRMGLPGYQWWSEALHGVGSSPGVTFSGDVPYATSFPQVITTGATFNKTLFHKIGQTISTEARAINNAGHAGLTFWTPNINLMRDPRWGRGQETPGEDPYLTSEYARHFVPGMQEGEDPRHIKASSCCKHYYAYDLENWGGVDRHSFNAIITKQDEADTYLPAFHSCVKNGRVSGLMCSYNAVNGVPSCANGRIMNEFARDAWGFEGYITSDCGAVYDVTYNHHYDTPNEAVRDTLEAGMDSDCGGFMSGNMKKSIEANVTKVGVVDHALIDLFAMQIRLGMFDNVAEQPYLKYTFADKVNTPEHQELALDAARQGTVLLKNDGTLPLKKSGLKIAMVGPSANITTLMQANYHGVAPYLISPLAGVSKYAQTTFNLGCWDQDCKNDTGFADAVHAAEDADVTVIVLGLSMGLEAEGRDRTNISLPGMQANLVQQVADAAKGPVIGVVVAGGSLDLSPLKNHPKVKGLLWMGYPGQSGGQALAEVLFGDYNPGGRLPHTQYPGSYLDNFSMFDMNMRPNASTNNTGRTYRFYTGEPVYSFGEGMSYTTFSYTAKTAKASVESVSVQQMCDKANLQKGYSVTDDDQEMSTVTVDVKNTGSVDGDATVLIFATPPQSTGAPKKFLVGFERVTLMAGATQSITFPLYYTAFSLVNTAGMHEPVVGGWKIDVGYDAAATVGFTVTN